MKKTAHTNRGTCQLCGRVQAVNNTTGAIAAHGYKVKGGYYSGECPGTNQLPAEMSIDITQQAMGIATKRAQSMQVAIVDFKAGTRTPEFIEHTKWNVADRRYDTTRTPYADGNSSEQRNAVERRVYELAHAVSRELAYVYLLEHFVVPQHGRPLKPPHHQKAREVCIGLKFEYAAQNVFEEWTVSQQWRGGYWNATTESGKSRRFSARRIRQLIPPEEK